jgi:nicotinamide-nucleotide amidase
VHFQVKFPEVLVKVVVRDRDAAEATARLERLDGAVKERVGRRLYGTGDDTLPAVLGRALSARGWTLSVAESCTGGLIGALVTGVAGSSEYFAGGAITYSNAEKVRQLGVAEATLEAQGAVSEACVREMARGAMERLGTDVAVAVSGVAGPGGGTDDKPVGLVWLAVAGPVGARTKRLMWPGSREQIRTIAAYWALMLVLEEAQVENIVEETRG